MRAHIPMIASTALFAACATVSPAPPTETFSLPKDAWTVGDSQGIELLARVVSMDTRQPRGHEGPAAKVLRDFLLRAGVEARLLPLGAGRASVFAIVRGEAPAGAAPIVLLSHLDTHPATPEAWPSEAGPFSAAIRRDALWGRGVVDGKGLAVLHALTLAVLQASRQPFERPVVMLAAAGGLSGDTPGLSQALAEEPMLGDAALVLTKGGGSVVDLLGDGRVVHTVATSERGFARIRITAAARSDESGLEDAAVARLGRALDAVLTQVSSPRLTRPTLDTLEAASEGVYFPKSVVMRTTPLARAFLLQDLAHRPSTAPWVHDELVVTRIGSNRAGGQVAPDRAWAVVEGRLLPGNSPGRLRARLKAAVRDPDVHVTVDAGAQWAGAPPNPDLLARVDRHARLSKDLDQVTVPTMSANPTGARGFREIGVPVYGFVPFVLSPEAWDRAFGRDERLPLEDFRRGLRVFATLTAELAGPVGYSTK